MVADLAKKDDVLKLYPEAPLLSSAGARWDGIHLEYHQQPPHQVPENALDYSQIVIHTQHLSSPLIEYMNRQRSQFEQMERGEVTIIPAYVNNWAIWDQECHFILLSFASTIFERYAAEWIFASNVELIPTFSQSDPLIHGIGLALKSELQNNGMRSCLYVDSLTSTLVTHLLRYYWVQKPISQPKIYGLSKQQLKQVTEYIDRHLEQDLTLATLAAIAQISPSYFSTLFKQSTGITPYQYVIQRRIERAKQLLLQGLSVAEVAFSLGFTHQSHLSRHFKRLVGVTPKVFLKYQ
ncbi:helix-turn-helix domain-containing protein [Aerosakkonemataceae cyanobacterium BLCC-F50]|uniref:Helix-turn-helix domain-containing protein n=1 Tax=Floridaenema flaviceps BLCC-F50 TaxID=3153642 RepID=A0ABV4Y4N0_9CYAN